jgi:tetratricopeptide (TPR) repeat protein
MKMILKLFVYALLGFVVMVLLVWLVDLSRYHQVVADWGRKLGYQTFAIEHYSTAIQLNGTRAGAFNSRGVARYNQGQYEEAIKDYDRAIELDPQYALAIKNRALSFLFLGKAEEGKRGYALACKLGRCEDFNSRCPELKVRCNAGECTGLQAAISAGLCPGQ